MENEVCHQLGCNSIGDSRRRCRCCSARKLDWLVYFLINRWGDWFDSWRRGENEIIFSISWRQRPVASRRRRLAAGKINANFDNLYQIQFNCCRVQFYRAGSTRDRLSWEFFYKTMIQWIPSRKWSQSRWKCDRSRVTPKKSQLWQFISNTISLISIWFS